MCTANSTRYSYDMCNKVSILFRLKTRPTVINRKQQNRKQQKTKNKKQQKTNENNKKQQQQQQN